MDKVYRTIKEMLKTQKGKVGLVRRDWLVTRKGIKFTVSVKKGDLLNE